MEKVRKTFSRRFLLARKRFLVRDAISESWCPSVFCLEGLEGYGSEAFECFDGSLRFGR